MGLGSNPRLGGSGPCCRIPLDADSNGLQTPLPPWSFKPAPTGSESQEHTCRRGFRGLYSIIFIYICLFLDGFAIFYQTGLLYVCDGFAIFTRRACDIYFLQSSSYLPDGFAIFGRRVCHISFWRGRWLPEQPSALAIFTTRVCYSRRAGSLPRECAADRCRFRSKVVPSVGASHRCCMRLWILLKRTALGVMTPLGWQLVTGSMWVRFVPWRL